MSEQNHAHEGDSLLSTGRHRLRTTLGRWALPILALVSVAALLITTNSAAAATNKPVGNWAGYAIRQDPRYPLYSVSGDIPVPTVTCNTPNAAISTWVGMGGFDSSGNGISTLVQAGLAVQCNGKTPVYGLFTQVRVPGPIGVGTIQTYNVHPNDYVHVQVCPASLKPVDATGNYGCAPYGGPTGQNFYMHMTLHHRNGQADQEFPARPKDRLFKANAQRTWGDCVVEDPSSRGRQVPFARTDAGVVPFWLCTIQERPGKGFIRIDAGGPHSQAYKLTMQSPGKPARATTSNPGGDPSGQGFEVYYPPQ